MRAARKVTSESAIQEFRDCVLSHGVFTAAIRLGRSVELFSLVAIYASGIRSSASAQRHRRRTYETREPKTESDLRAGSSCGAKGPGSAGPSEGGRWRVPAPIVLLRGGQKSGSRVAKKYSASRRIPLRCSNSKPRPIHCCAMRKGRPPFA